MTEIKHLRKIAILFYSTTVKFHILISSSIDVKHEVVFKSL